MQEKATHNGKYNMLPSDLKINASYLVDSSKIMYQLPPMRFIAVYEGTMGDSRPFYSFSQQEDVIFPLFSLTGMEVFNAVSYINLDELIS